VSLGAVDPPEPRPLRVVDSSLRNNARDVALNQPFTIRFNQYLDTGALDIFGAVEARSGGIRARSFVRYSAVDRSLTFFPVRNFQPSLIYRLTVDDELVLPLDGAPLEPSFNRRFQTAEGGTVEQHREVDTVYFDESIAPLFESGCGCHYTSDGLASLAYDDLVGVPSEQHPSALLVRPFDPPRSYLLMKVLRDYPGRRLDRMPPPWSDEPTLGVDSLHLIEDWIETGAQR